MTPVIINLERPETWPSDVLRFLEANYELFLDWESPDGEVGARSYDKAIYGLRDVLAPYFLKGLHCTKLTSEEIHKIKTLGMSLPNETTLANRIDTATSKGLITREVASRLKAEHDAGSPYRAGMLWFCFFPPRIGGESGVGDFFRFWGGEALYRSHHNDPVTGPAIGAFGIPCLVEAVVPIAALKGSLEFKIVRRYLKSRGFQTSEPVDHEDRAVVPLGPDWILRIMEYPDPEFVALTGCDKWRRKLPYPDNSTSAAEQL